MSRTSIRAQLRSIIRYGLSSAALFIVLTPLSIGQAQECSYPDYQGTRGWAAFTLLVESNYIVPLSTHLSTGPFVTSSGQSLDPGSIEGRALVAAALYGHALGRLAPAVHSDPQRTRLFECLLNASDDDLAKSVAETTGNPLKLSQALALSKSARMGAEDRLVAALIGKQDISPLEEYFDLVVGPVGQPARNQPRPQPASNIPFGTEVGSATPAAKHVCVSPPYTAREASWTFYGFGGIGATRYEYRGTLCSSRLSYFTIGGGGLDKYECEKGYVNCRRAADGHYVFSKTSTTSEGHTRYDFPGGGWVVRKVNPGAVAVTPPQPVVTPTPASNSCSSWITLTLQSEAPAQTCAKYKADGWKTRVTATDCLICSDDGGGGKPSAPGHDVNGKYHDLIENFGCAQDVASYGEFYDWGYWPGGNYCGAVRAAGHYVFHNGSWAVWKTKVDAPGTGGGGKPKPSDVGHDVNGKYYDLIENFGCAQDVATYGDFYDWGYWPGGNYCGAYRAAGYYVFHGGSWAVWRTKVK